MVAQFVLLALICLLQVATPPDDGDDEREASSRTIVVDRFEEHPVDGSPLGWKYIYEGRELREVPPEPDNDREYFVIKKEKDGNRFVRAYTEGEATSIIRVNGEDFEWNLDEHPRLRWRWRARELPKDASEREEDRNDAGGAVYVTFSRDWLGRPKSIKYTYSSTLPVGTVVSYGRLRVLVVDSGREKTGKWKQVERNVINDYRQVFGGDPPDKPLSIALWSDSDSVPDGKAEVDFDDLVLLPPRR